MKTKFEFDKKTGTMVPADNGVKQALKANVRQDVIQSKPNTETQKPIFKEEKKIEVKAPGNVNVQQNQIVQMKRVKRPTPIQLIDDKGMPEAYLDTESMGVMMFRQTLDYDICQITDEKTGKILGFIGGYALQINFNMSELRTMEKIEECLQGLIKLFRHKIMTQTLGNSPADK